MKTLFDLTGRFSLFAVFVVIVVGFSGSMGFGQGGQGKVIPPFPNPNTGQATLVQPGPSDCQKNIKPDKAAWQVTNRNCQKAADAFQAAAAFVLGPQLSDDQLLNYVALKGNGNYDPSFDAKFNAGMQSTDAAGFLKELIAADAGVRESVLNAAYMEVYGFNADSIPRERYYPLMRTQKAWFATIVQNESGRLNTTPGLRTSMIQRAYNASFGRDATATLVTYWTPMEDDYAHMIEKNRCWLYSPSGSQELFDSIKRAMIATHPRHKPPSDSKVNASKKGYVFIMHSVYFEMVVHEADGSYVPNHPLICGS